jgi:D-alanyl-D-alanine carboxypeptidase
MNVLSSVSPSRFAVNRAMTAGVASLACAMLTLSTAAPAAVATSVRADVNPPRMGDVQQALNTLAKTSGVVGAIGEVYVDGKRATLPG